MNNKVKLCQSAWLDLHDQNVVTSTNDFNNIHSFKDQEGKNIEILHPML